MEGGGEDNGKGWEGANGTPRKKERRDGADGRWCMEATIMAWDRVVWVEGTVRKTVRRDGAEGRWRKGGR